MNAQYWKGGIIMLACFLAFIFASRKQFYARRSLPDTYTKYVGSGVGGCLWMIIKVMAILLFLYGLAMILQEGDRH